MKTTYNQYVYIGTWGSDIQGNENAQQASEGGIKSYGIGVNDTFDFLSNVSPEVNAGIIYIARDKHFLYAVNERKDINGSYGNGGGVCAYGINQEDGTLEFINEVSSIGAYPCYITADAENRCVFIVNHGNHDDVVTKARCNEHGIYETYKMYDDGSIAMFFIGEDGSVGECCDVKIFHGNSVDRQFQSSPHPHSVCVDPSNKFVVVADKGCDKIIVYHIDYQRGKMEEVVCYDTLPGTGPRHIAFHPYLKIMYVNSEISSTVNAFEYDFEIGKIELIDTIKTIPKSYRPLDPSDHFASNSPADIRVHNTGKFLYVSNRGHNSIASYRLDDQGRMTLINFTFTNGEVPRAINFNVDEDKIYAVNQRSGNIVRFNLDEKSGNLDLEDFELKLNNPVCIQFLNI